MKKGSSSNPFNSLRMWHSTPFPNKKALLNLDKNHTSTESASPWSKARGLILQFFSVESSLTVLEGEANNLETTLVIFLHETPALSSVYQSFFFFFSTVFVMFIKAFSVFCWWKVFFYLLKCFVLFIRANFSAVWSSLLYSSEPICLLIKANLC